MTILEIVKVKLPQVMEASPQMELCVTEAEQKARNYCNIPDEEELPQALCYTIANMALDLIRQQASLVTMEPAEESSGPVKSVTMGDVSYNFDTTAETTRQTTLNQLLHNYEIDLKKFRRIRRCCQ